jgi:hypothetical protein
VQRSESPMIRVSPVYLHVYDFYMIKKNARGSIITLINNSIKSFSISPTKLHSAINRLYKVLNLFVVVPGKVSRAFIAAELR